MKIKKVEWCIAFRARKERLLYEDAEDLSGFSIIKNSSRYWCADPFALQYEGADYVFFEMYDRLKRKGCLGYRRIETDGRISRMKKIYEDDCHLSYPNIFRYKDDFYIIPESNQKQQLYVLKATHFPDKWEKVSVLADSIRLADTTFLQYGETAYAFSTPIGEDNVSCLSVCTVRGKMTDWDKLRTPILCDKSKARMAGNFLRQGETVIRVSQNCESTYGGGLVFSEVKRLDENGYEEETIAVLRGDGLQIASKKYDGIHTYNCDERYEFIDLKINEKFSLVEMIGFLRNKLISFVRR